MEHTHVMVNEVLSEEFEVEVGIHQGLSVKPFLLITVLKEISRTCRTDLG